MIEIRSDSGWEPCFIPIWPQGKREKGGPVLAEMPTLARAYGLFSLLADVVNRNGRLGTTVITKQIEGVGEVQIPYDMDDGGHEPIVPIAEPRGVPDDAWGGWLMFTQQEGIHSPTWFTLDELDVDHPMWDQLLHEDAVVIEEEYLEYKQTGNLPKHLARGVGGTGVRTVTEEEYEAGERGQQTAIRIKYARHTIRDDAGPAWWATMAAMRLVAPDDDKTRVRMLIAFDS
jgi:hypothetical protein